MAYAATPVPRPTALTREDFARDRQGRTFSDVLNDPEQPLVDKVLEFFAAADRQQRMRDAGIHHDRPPLAGVVRELEAQSATDGFLSSMHPRRTKRLRQAIGVVVRMVMERMGWKKTGKKGCLGVRVPIPPRTVTPGAYHNKGGLSLWFLRAERYEPNDGLPYPTVRARLRRMHAASQPSSDL